jgi:hypothetical protein
MEHADADNSGMLVGQVERRLHQFVHCEVCKQESDTSLHILEDALVNMRNYSVGAQRCFNSLELYQIGPSVAQAGTRQMMYRLAQWGRAITQAALVYPKAFPLIAGCRAKEVDEMMNQVIDMHDKLHAIMTRSVTCLLSLPDNPVHK